MKSQFFMNLNDMVLNKNDELKYLILMREEFFKYKLKMYYFRKWKSRALYNHDLLDEDDPFQNNDAENYQNFKNLNYMGQGVNRNSFNNNNNLKNSLLDSKIGNNPNLLIFDDDEQKKKEIKLEDSIKVLDVQKDINNALSNANNIFSQINGKNSKDNENEQYNNILLSLEKMKKNVIKGDNLTDNKNINNNDSKDKNNNNNNAYEKFNDLLIKKYDEDNEKNKDINYIQKKNNLLSIHEQMKSNKSYNKDGKKSSKSQNKKNNKEKENEDNINNKSKSKKKFDPKKLYKYPIKDNNDNDEDKYKDSKYISTKYKDYLHIGQRENNKSKSKSKSKPKNKLNDLYKEIQNNLKNDETLLRRLELKRDISNQNIYGNKNRSKSKNKKENLLDKLNVNNKNLNKLNRFFNYDNSKNFEENLKNNGFFSGKNKKKGNIAKEDIKDSNEDTYPDKIREIIEKYQNKDDYKLDGNNKSKGKKKVNENYDYIKKIKASEKGFYPKNNFYPYYNNNINNNINNAIKSKIKDNDYDEEYEELFHPKNNIRNNYNNINNNNQLNASEYSNSVYNIINNIDDYDNLINGLNQPKYNRIEKKRIVHHPRKSQKSYLDNNIIENSISNNSAFILAPMKDVPITNISFRARMKYFSDKKKQNLEKMIKNKKEEEKQIYTFHPKTGINKLNVIKYDNYLKTENNIINNKKRLPDYERINNLYLDYKDKKMKRDELTKEYYKKAGISFTPKINDKNKEIKEFKNKIGQIPYLDRIDIYNANKQYYNNDKCNLMQREFY